MRKRLGDLSGRRCRFIAVLSSAAGTGPASSGVLVQRRRVAGVDLLAVHPQHGQFALR